MFWIPLSLIRIPQPLWTTCASVCPPIQQKSVFLHSNWISWFSASAHCFFWAPLNRAWLCLLYTLQIFVHIANIPLSLFFSTLNGFSSLSLSSHETYSGPSVIFTACHWTQSSNSVPILDPEPDPAPAWTLCSKLVSPALSREKGSPPSPCWQWSS